MPRALRLECTFFLTPFRKDQQREKFFFKSLAGVPLANKVKKAGTALSGDGTDGTVEAVEALVSEIEDKADAPGTVLT